MGFKTSTDQCFVMLLYTFVAMLMMVCLLVEELSGLHSTPHASFSLLQSGAIGGLKSRKYFFLKTKIDDSKAHAVSKDNVEAHARREDEGKAHNWSEDPHWE